MLTPPVELQVRHPGIRRSFPPQVLRFSALGFGVAYGIWHQSTLTAKAKHNQIEREHQHQLSLREKAKKEYAKKLSPEVEGGECNGFSKCSLDLVVWGRAGVSMLERSSAEEWFGVAGGGK